MDIAKWLVIGILIAAFLDIVIPSDFFISYLSNEWLSMLIILGASVPLYICATASVPIAAILMLKGLSPSAALVLLMSGPATNAATITVIKNIFGGKTLMAYLSSIIGGALLFETIINNFSPRNWFMMITDTNHLHHHEVLPEWLQLSASAMLVGLILLGYIKQWKSSIKNLENLTQAKAQINSVVLNNTASVTTSDFASFTIAKPLITKKYTVEGMTCSHCKNSVEQSLLKLNGIVKVIANPQSNDVLIDGEELDDATIQDEIEKLGYIFKGITADK